MAELSKPVTQRVLPRALRSGREDMLSLICHAYWPNQAQAHTNVLCAIMQARPCQLRLFTSILCRLKHVMLFLHKSFRQDAETTRICFRNCCGIHAFLGTLRTLAALAVVMTS